MRDPIENITLLQRQINELQIENQLLKNLLSQNGVSYEKSLLQLKTDERVEEYELNQGKRIIHPDEITEEMANIFFSRFWGRQDVYAKRSVNRTTGKVGYYPQCVNFWSNKCHIRLKTGIKCKDCDYYVYDKLTKDIILSHLRGDSYNGSDVIGVYPLFPNGTCRFLVFDFDNHGKNAENNDFANETDEWIEEVEAMRKICSLNGIDPLVERSRSGRGAHIWIFFDKQIPAVLINEKMHPNEAYDILHNDKIRDEQIIEDISACIKQGRTPVVLSKYKDHSEKLYHRLKEYANHVFLMTGNNSKKVHRQILEQMKLVSANETMILVATGSLIGEGFDFPRLDTLFMAMPVSARNIVEQYAGRLNRDFDGKQNVIVYDYVDSHIPMFDNMYAKRLKAYKQIGYEVCTGIVGEKQTANAIYDGDNYLEVFQRDLLEATKNIVISSPIISGEKVYKLISLLKEKQSLGVEITIVTWEPDSYGFGDASYWMQLHEEMRQAGFYLKFVEDTCEHFAIIDKEIVWYGNINLLAKEKIEDSMMRVKDAEIASELMEITFC